MSEKKQADVQELVQELSHCNDVQSLQETAHSMGKDLSEEDSRGLFDLLGTAASNQVFSSLVSGNQASSGLNLGTLLNFASGQTQQAQVQQNPQWSSRRRLSAAERRTVHKTADGTASDPRENREDPQIRKRSNKLRKISQLPDFTIAFGAVRIL